MWETSDAVISGTISKTISKSIKKNSKTKCKQFRYVSGAKDSPVTIVGVALQLEEEWKTSGDCEQKFIE